MVAHGILYAQMIIAQTSGIARPTSLAVKIILTTSNSADPTIVTMKLALLNIIIVEFADVTEIFPHIDATVSTNLSNRLLGVTNRTNNLFDILAD